MEYKSNYQNPYIIWRSGKENLKFTKKKQKQYLRLKKLSEWKLFQNPKSPLSKILEGWKKKAHYKFMDYHFCEKYQKANSKQQNIDKDVEFDSLFIYDLIPRELIPKYKQGLYDFSQNCEWMPGDTDESFLTRQFSSLETQKQYQSIHNLGFFRTSEKLSIQNWVRGIAITLEEYGDSFCLLSYKLTLTDKPSKELKSILTSFVTPETICIKMKDKKRCQIKSTLFGFCKRRAINNLILEIEYNFFDCISKYVPCFFHSNNVIAPSLGVYVVENLDNSEKLLEVLGFSGHEYDKNESEGMHINLTTFSFMKQEESISSCLIDKSKSKNSIDNLYVLGGYPAMLAEFYITYTLKNVISSTIIKAQEKLNGLLANKLRASKLLTAKKETLVELFIYKRFVKDVLAREKAKISSAFDIDFHNPFAEKATNGECKTAHQVLRESNYFEYAQFDNQINGVYEFYDDTLATVESSTNIHLVRTTLIVTAIAGVIALVALLTNETVLDFFNGLLSYLKNII